MELIKHFLGLIIQCIGLVISIPCFLLMTLGGWFVDLGDTLRMDGD